MSESRTAFVLLAAGESSRMGRAKQLLEFHGKPLLRHAVDRALEAGCSPIIVVLGARAPQLQPTLEGLPVHIVINDQWEQGMGTSIQAGLAAAADSTGLILGLVDLPLVTAHFLRSLIHEHQATGKPIVAARYSGTFGVPVYFARSAYSWLAALSPGQGCKGVIAANPEARSLLDCPEAAIDVDTPEDYAVLAGSHMAPH